MFGGVKTRSRTRGAALGYHPISPYTVQNIVSYWESEENSKVHYTRGSAPSGLFDDKIKTDRVLIIMRVPARFRDIRPKARSIRMLERRDAGTVTDLQDWCL